MKARMLFLNLTVFVLFTISVAAQVEEPVQTPPANNANVRSVRLLQALGLTREQIQQIRRINQERKTVVLEAQRRWRLASRQLDDAVYAVNANDETIAELTKAAQTAQSELLKEKTLTEYLIRKVLTPEQLVKFRELRQQMAQRLNNRNQTAPKNADQNRPLERIQQRRNQDKPQ